jgi:hypothetical protein
LPLPSFGRIVDGAIIERTNLETLQATAVDGIAAAHTSENDEKVLDIMRHNASATVRSEAIAAYIFNARDPQEARERLRPIVQPGDAVYIDLPRRTPTTTPEEFNRQLSVYLRLHPDRVPPAPPR